MNNSKIIMVTSCKGGVGKSTISANLGVKLALEGHKTLVLDCDFGVRSLDLIMGLEDSVIYDISDIILHSIAPEKAIVGDPRSENLFFCAAPYNCNGEITEEAFSEAVDKISETIEPEYIIIDTPGDMGLPFKLAASVADTALVVSTYQPASIRAAERTGLMLSELGLEDFALIINCFDGKSRDGGPGLLEIIDKTCIRLIGIIPYEAELAAKQANGLDVFTIPKSNASVAFSNITMRLLGKNVPLFTGFKKIKRTALIDRIQ